MRAHIHYIGYILAIIAGLMTACEKEGCTDMRSLNFSAEADKDDGSCIRPTKCILKGIDLQILSPTGDMGVVWESDGLPDCFIEIRSNLDSVIATTPVISDIPIGEIVHYSFEPDLVFDIAELPMQNSFSVRVFEHDDTSNTQMALSVLYNTNLLYFFNDYSGETFYHRRRLTNFWMGGYNEQVCMTAILEWE